MTERLTLKKHQQQQQNQSSVAVWKSRWPSWASVPNKPTVSVDVKQHSTNNKSHFQDYTHDKLIANALY